MTLGQFLLGILVLIWCAYEAGLLRQLRREGVLIVLTLGTWITSAATSAQDQEILPLLGVVPLAITVLLVTVVREHALQVNKYLVSIVLAIALLLIVHLPKNSLLSWMFSHASVPTIADPVARLSRSDIERLDLELPPRVNPSLFGWMPKNFIANQLEALRLLQRFNVGENDVLYVAADQSSLNMFTGARYPKGYVVWWPFIYLNQPEKLPLVDDRLLEDVDWILRGASFDDFWRYLNFHRRDYLQKEFEPVAEEGLWTLYRRKIN
jgi:hypothetical protein